MSQDIFNDSDSKEDDIIPTSLIWGGEVINTNEITMPNIIIDLGVPIPTPITGRVRRRENITPPESVKYLRSNNGTRVLKRDPNSYLKLASGEELEFNKNDGKNILLNEYLEPNRLIRNIISKLPLRVSDRLDHLAKFIDEEIKDKVYEAYIKEWRLRFIFKRIIILWRAYKMNKSAEPDLDPITLCYPEKEIIIYDWDNKKRFSFEAKSISLLIESKLSYQEYGFPVPLYPKNPKTNTEFTYKQLVSLYFQLKECGELRWGFTTLREYNFNKNRWHLYHKSLLTMNAIKVSLTALDTSEAREMFIDFIFAKMEELSYAYSQYMYSVFQIAIATVPNHWYLDRLKALAISHYEGEHLGQVRTRIINAGCIKIFRKLNVFLRDLQNKNIIK